MKKSQIVANRLIRNVMLLCATLLSINSVFAKDFQVDINALMSETQMMSQEVSEMTMVWWVPEDFWRVSFEQDPSMSAAEAEDFLKVLRPYMLFVAVDGTVGTFGGITYKPEDDIRNNFKLVDNKGNSYDPLGKAKIDADTINLLSMMKPMFANMLGEMGQNMHFFLFDAKNTVGQVIASPKKAGGFSVKMGDRAFSWELPLGSLLPPKQCPVDKKILNGGWKYCPWHGVELKEAH